MPRQAAVTLSDLPTLVGGGDMTGAARELAHELANGLTRELARHGGRPWSDILARRERPARPSRTRDLTTPPESTPQPSAAALEPGSDEALLVAHREGDPDALRRLIERYRNDLHGFLTRLVGSRTGADDVFQEAFLQVHLSSESFDRTRRFRPWLYTIAANKGRDYLRRQKRRAAASLDAPLSRDGDGTMVDLLAGTESLPALPLEAADERNIVKQVVEEMPHHFREILLLSYFQRLSYAQIAESLAIPLGTVKSRLHAAVACFASSFRLACERRGLPLPEQRGDERGIDGEVDQKRDDARRRGQR